MVKGAYLTGSEAIFYLLNSLNVSDYCDLILI
jgi:hypothetical protein